MNIICVKWGVKFTHDDVNKLYAQVKRNLTIPFSFICFTDSSEGINPAIECRDLPYTTVEGWWQKLYLFSKEANLKGRNFFLDLDTVITNNIDAIASTKGEFVILRDVFYGLVESVKETDCGSAVMLWDDSNYSYVWDDFIANPKAAMKSIHPHGDQRWIQAKIPERRYFQDMYEKKIVSFKKEILLEKVRPEAVNIVCFHGEPSIRDAITNDITFKSKRYPPQKWILSYYGDEKELWRNNGIRDVTPSDLDLPEGWDVRTYLSDIVGENSVIDIGCGYGRLSKEFKNYTGVDINRDKILKARSDYPDKKFKLIDDVDELSETYDWGLLYTVLIHISDENIKRFVSQCVNHVDNIIVAEIMSRKFRSVSGKVPAFNRAVEEYVSIFEECGLQVNSITTKPYKKYDYPITFITAGK
jgi:2-polyprenyl-3-methyl-5-hydroxy-6-metoxy-1,4-benzoquinol methylase